MVLLFICDQTCTTIDLRLYLYDVDEVQSSPGDHMETQAHHPPHQLENDTWYAISASTYQRQALLREAGTKQLLRDRLKRMVIEHHFQLAAWVVLNNHYHLLMKCPDGSQIPQIIAHLHGGVSYDLNHREGRLHRRVWDNYWDTGIRTEVDYWTRFNYIHHNPIKHGYTQDMGSWPYSSYGYYLKHKGAEWLADAFSQYPIRDFTERWDI
jgi:putative transposase